MKFTYPVGLNQPRLIANTNTRPNAIRNPGMANPSTVITCTTRSTQPPRTAAHTPSSTEMIAITTVAPTTIDNVTANREVIPSTTGWPVNQESPKSPVKAFFSQVKYCVSSGSFRPNCWAFAATASCGRGLPEDAAGDVTAAEIQQEERHRGNHEQQQQTCQQSLQNESKHRRSFMSANARK